MEFNGTDYFASIEHTDSMKALTFSSLTQCERTTAKYVRFVWDFKRLYDDPPNRNDVIFKQPFPVGTSDPILKAKEPKRKGPCGI